MLTPDYLNALPESIVPLWQDVEDFILRDISRRLKKMGGVTGTAELQRIALNNIGKDLKDIDKEIAKALNLTQEQVTELFGKAMDTATADVEKTAQTAGITIYKSNAQRITQAAAAAANGDIANLTKTMGFLSRGGQFTMWTDAYRRALSLAALQVSSGAVDYNTAIRMTLSQFADHGLVVEYASGARRSLEAAIRQNVLSGVSMAANEVLADNAKQIGADGWEISAHAACAPDHEPIQGRQYSTEDYEQLNNRLSRPIGTLGCRHIASPIIMGISEPAYSEKELSDMAKRNAEGITYEGKHYTAYEATQFQRKLERAVRKTKRELIGAEESGDKDMFTAKSIKLRRLREYYKDFSAKAGLLTQNERAQVAGFGRSLSGKVVRIEKNVYKEANRLYNLGSQEANVDAYLKELPTISILKNNGIEFVRQISDKEVVVKVSNVHIASVRKHVFDNLSEKADRANMTPEKAQEFIDNAKLVLYQDKNSTLKFLSKDGYAVLNMNMDLVTAVPQKWRKKYDEYLRGR